MTNLNIIDQIIEIIIGTFSVIGLLYIGIIIGREFGTFENFILKFLESIKSRMIQNDTQ